MSSSRQSTEQAGADAPAEARCSNITTGHLRAFQWVTSGRYDDRITLANCTINGEQGVAIIIVEQVSQSQFSVAPLFVAITPNMKIELDSDRGGSGGTSEGGPSRYDELRDFVPPAPGGVS